MSGLYQKVEGLILREVNYQDSDKLLDVLTKDRGLITLRARGVRSRSSRLRGACQLFCYSELTYFDRQGHETIQEAVSLEQFTGLRQDMEKLALASYFAQVAQTVSQADFFTDELLSLILNAFYALSALNRPKELVKAVFELRVCLIAGFAPQLDVCPVCGSSQPDGFNVSQGSVQCLNCSGLEGIRLPVCQGTLSALRYICNQTPKKLFSFQISDSALCELSAVCETYLVTQMERGFSALDFYKTLLIP